MKIINLQLLPVLAGALGFTLSLARPLIADEPEPPKRPPVEKARREAGAQQREAEERRDRAESERREGEPRRPEGRRDESNFQPHAHEAQELHQRFQDLVAAGRMEEAAQVKRHLDEMEAPRGESRKPQAQGGHGPEEAGQRLKHLVIAIENLHAAGNHELAEGLQRQVEQMNRHAQEPRGPGLPGPHQPGFNQPGPGQPEPHQIRPDQPAHGQPPQDPRAEELHATVRRLNSAVQELREQVQDLRKQLEPRKK